MNSGFGKLAIFVVGLSIFFTYIGILFLPQSQSLPPKIIEIKEGIEQDELLKIGEDILFGKGQCMVCHPYKPEGGMRSPAIAGIGGVIEERVKGMDVSAEDYVFQALVDTKAYIPKGFAPIMPPSQKLLTEGELIAVAAFLQSKGGEVTISYPDSLPALRKSLGSTEKKVQVAAVEIKEGISPAELIKIGKDLYYDKGACIDCHPDAPDPDVEFPLLAALADDVSIHAKEKGKDPDVFLFESLVNPEAYVAEGMDAVMPATQDSLSESEMVAVSAFIQSQNGSVTVKYPDSLSILKKEIEKVGGQ